MVKPVSKKVLQLVALKAIAKHILTIPAKEWNMQLWYRSNECGTTGCAIGHSRNLPEVKAIGLQVENRISEAFSYFQPFSSDLTIEGGMPSVAHAFGVSITTANYMFGTHIMWGLSEQQQLYPMRSPEELTQQAVHDRIMEVVNGEYK